MLRKKGIEASRRRAEFKPVSIYQPIRNGQIWVKWVRHRIRHRQDLYTRRIAENAAEIKRIHDVLYEASSSWYLRIFRHQAFRSVNMDYSMENNLCLPNGCTTEVKNTTKLLGELQTRISRNALGDCQEEDILKWFDKALSHKEIIQMLCDDSRSRIPTIQDEIEKYKRRKNRLKKQMQL